MPHRPQLPRAELPRPQLPRPIHPHEALILRRVVEVGADPAAAPALLNGIDGLVVVEEGNGFMAGSLDFGSDDRDRVIVAGALGRMDGGGEVELVIWADGAAITHLQLDPHNGALGRARLPPWESIHAYPPNAYGNDED